MMQQELYFYYLPCLNPEVESFGGIIGVERKVEIGDVLTNWDFPVEVTYAAECEKQLEPDLKGIPYLKVKAIDLKSRREPKNVYITG